MMRDLTNSILNEKDAVKNPVYITRERTFILCLFVYFDGDLTKALDFPFLQEIGFLENPLPDNLAYSSVILRMFVRIVQLFYRYASFLSNRETVERFYTFYAFSFQKNFNLLSIDFVLMKFCLMVLKKLNVRADFFSNLFTRPF